MLRWTMKRSMKATKPCQCKATATTCSSSVPHNTPFKIIKVNHDTSLESELQNVLNATRGFTGGSFFGFGFLGMGTGLVGLTYGSHIYGTVYEAFTNEDEEDDDDDDD
eukprot:PhF_6_TR25438/c0_g1_i1/m.35162